MKSKKESPKVRLLPGDFQRYLSLDDTDKRIVPQTGKRGFFQFPADFQGIQDIGIRNFLVFYFDRKEDYEIVKRFFEIPGGGRSHPLLDEKKLVDLIKRI